MDVAIKHGMEVIECRKPDMHVHNEVGLYGTREQMKAVEAEWTANGNTPKPRNFHAVFKVNLDQPREKWVTTRLAAAKQAAISNEGGTIKLIARNGDEVVAPLGYRSLIRGEIVCKSDIAWDGTAKVWNPVDLEMVEYYGPKRFTECANLILRRI